MLLTRALSCKEETEALGCFLVKQLRPGDVIALEGDVGMGKTTFVRAALQSVHPDLIVPSPTFTLVQTYTLGAVSFWHFDLYRLEAPEDVIMLDMETAFTEGISFVEWPQRAQGYMPSRCLWIELLSAPYDQRRAHIRGGEAWAERLKSVP